MTKLKLLPLLFCLCLAANAQQPTPKDHPMIAQQSTQKDHPMISEHEQNACSGEHKPGDRSTCFLIFDGDPDIQGMTVYFRLQGSPQENQVGLSTEYSLPQWRKIGRGEYAVEGQVGDCAKGTYRLTYVSVVMRGIGKNYWYGPDFKDVLQVDVVNDVDLHFPKIKDISAEPPKEEKAAVEPVRK